MVTHIENFHPAVEAWFRSCFDQPTPVQELAWPAIKNGRHTLLAAPTGSGKTLAAFLAAIDDLVRESVAGTLPDETQVLYVSPLKALSNDIEKNLQQPLQGIHSLLCQEATGSAGVQQDLLQEPDRVKEAGEMAGSIRAAVRTGDTPASERARMRRKPPHILVTTPESLYILLTSESGRQMLTGVRTVIVDELHAVAGNKRGAHLSLSLERLDALCLKSPVRIGVSATQKPIEKMARFLVGNREDDCAIIDTGFVRERDLQLVLPSSALQPVMAAEVWTEIYDRLAELVRNHRSTLIFVNTRRLAERVARHLAERLGETAVTAHHGSLAREHRLDAEQRLKSGQLEALVATASLELGIDIGDVDLTCQLSSPRAIAVFLQRVGRSGHGISAIPKGRLFPMTRDDLLECTALLDSVRREELDAVHLQGPALDVLAQQIVAEVSAREWHTDGLFQLVGRARPYSALSRETFDQVIRMLADGYTTRRGRQAIYIHHDAVNGRLRARRGARLVALTNGGAIPDQFDYDVVLLPQEFSIGSLNEDFAFESLPGDIFQLGNISYRILKIETGKVLVEDARGQPPNIPFWFGEVPGRTDELSLSVSRLREKLSQLLDGGVEPARRWLESELGLDVSAAEQLVDYLAGAKLALGVVPTQSDIVLERFFDEVGDTHLVIHSPFGARLNRAWGLALRKRFCRKFNFELQAAALEDCIVLSLGPTHSFPLEEVAGYLKAGSVRKVLVQAMLNAPMFPARWRWAATIALAVRRNRNGKKIPPYFQRSDAEDLMAVVFPDQLACAENIVGDRELPDHPLVNQTVHDCLHEVMDINGLEPVLEKIADGRIRVTARDLTSPSPLAQEIITARPYAFLDDAPAEERRTQAVRARHLLDPQDAANLGQLDQEVIKSVCQNAWPDVRDADELHDALVLSGFLGETEVRTAECFEGKSVSVERWTSLLGELIEQKRATIVTTPPGIRIWVAAERLAQLQVVLPSAVLSPEIEPVTMTGRGNVDDCSVALREIIRSRLETLGPVTTAELAAPLGNEVTGVQDALLTLESEGYAIARSVSWQ